MALRFLDSFDHYTDKNMKWTGGLYGAVGSGGLHGNRGSGDFGKGMNFPTNTIIMECYVHRRGGGQVFALSDTTSGALISCALTGLGNVRVDQYNGAQLFLSDPDIVRPTTWYHFGWRVFCHASAGTVEVRLNGEEICHVTGVSTISTLGWSGMIGAFGIGDFGNAVDFDDLVVMDDVDDGLNDPRLPGGGGFDKFIGPVEIKCKYADGPGFTTEWVPTPTPPNWDNVNEHAPDGDTTYNSAAPTAVGASDLFAMENLDADEDVVGVQSLILMRKTEEGVAAGALLVREGGTTTVGATIYQPNSYSYMHRPEPTLPDGSLWTKARWDAIQYGYRRIL